MSVTPDDTGSSNDQSNCWLQGIWAAVPTPFLADQSLDFGGIARMSVTFATLWGWPAFSVMA
jgi:hypothetical protein